MEEDLSGPAGPPDEASDRFRRPEHRRVLPSPQAHECLPELGPPGPTVDESALRVREPSVDLVQTPRRLYVTVDLPGASKDTIDLGVQGERLTVHAVAQDGFVYHCDVDLGEAVEPGAMKATYLNGVLDVTVPRGPPRRAREPGGERDG